MRRSFPDHTRPQNESEFTDANEQVAGHMAIPIFG
jgi:hypothetical protein